jgi:hypothetical protein
MNHVTTLHFIILQYNIDMITLLINVKHLPTYNHFFMSGIFSDWLNNWNLFDTPMPTAEGFGVEGVHRQKKLWRGISYVIQVAETMAQIQLNNKQFKNSQAFTDARQILLYEVILI